MLKHRKKSIDEYNLIRKRDFDIRIGLLYPNQYKIGNSCLAFRLIYDLLNSYEQIYCERIFKPEIEGVSPTSIETKSSLHDFHFIFVSVQFELDYINLFKMFESVKIPFNRKARENIDSPYLIFLGGPVPTANPFLASAIADIVFLGEIEPALTKITDCLFLHKREEILQSLSDFPGFWIPAQDQFSSEIIRTKHFHNPIKQTIPVARSKEHREVFSDHFLLQVSRGCSRSCSFCLIGHTRKPAIHAPIQQLLEVVKNGLEATPAKRVSLIGSSAADHPGLQELLYQLNDNNIPFSLPSLRIDSDKEIIKELVKTGQKTITIAPESIIESERFSLGKKITNSEIFNYVSTACKLGINDLRIYLINGLPGENYDIQMPLNNWKTELDYFVTELRSNFHKGRIKISFSPFIPKPQTSFQNSIPNIERMKEEQKESILLLKKKKIRFSLGSIRWAPIQAYLSLAGESTVETIEKVGKRGGGLIDWKKTVGDFEKLLHEEAKSWETRFSLTFSNKWL